MSSAIGYNIQSALHAEDSPEIPGESWRIQYEKL